ncbi:MAG TPA: amidohydrolase [Candidatus Ratteibacteria bacterium]|jgi:amidohydrolase|uniref:N-acyl-L-amino acid amidohydrolase n=1 Tax=candidate division TA06 bacterium ADurb.Bin131 TaxID=1852827 RepID=A0A1V6CAD7_UNCT6|nr:MAG: N-acyl-L-amino acid amidohydrolase [candidate division TA06 bacterium ADurb.Bin131]HOC02109.1 amidohydrolase [bacterium]HQL64227.1 amidohydrolase [bacterium]HRS05985.1 amidohydrolase [Candidatus Ratteibacteria bacterium]HRV04046.1 amidohydrolase [Candidatus Ratteibacteria bacterium]
MMNIIQEIDRISELFKEDVIKWRREFHKYPELSNQEKQTSLRIQKILKSFNIKFSTAAQTGVIAEIPGGKKILGIRADMDALPVKEETGLDFASENQGIMHACGHDAHMAIALGVMAVFSKIKNLPFSLRAIFQPAEESFPCGAPRMIEEGALMGMKYLIGFHVWPSLKIGTFSVIKGPVMASADRFSIQIKGKGGHGASPHKAIDSIVASAHFISEIQTIVSRRSDPQNPLVISVGKISGGDAFNVIPEQVEILGTVRTFDQKQNILAEKNIKTILKGIETGFRVKTYLKYEEFVPSTYNDPLLSEKVIDILSSCFGKKSVITDEKPSMGSEDFSFYSRLIPCCYINIGCGKSEYFNHSSRFTINEGCLVSGIKAISRILWEIGSTESSSVHSCWKKRQGE